MKELYGTALCTELYTLRAFGSITESTKERH